MPEKPGQKNTFSSGSPGLLLDGFVTGPRFQERV